MLVEPLPELDAVPGIPYEKRPVVDVLKIDGNAFSILGTVNAALKKAGLKAEAETYLKEATSGDYDNLLAVTMSYVKLPSSDECDDDDVSYSCDEDCDNCDCGC
jgi:hypothetical protein